MRRVTQHCTLHFYDYPRLYNPLYSFSYACNVERRVSSRLRLLSLNRTRSGQTAVAANPANNFIEGGAKALGLSNCFFLSQLALIHLFRQVVHAIDRLIWRKASFTPWITEIAKLLPQSLNVTKGFGLCCTA